MYAEQFKLIDTAIGLIFVFLIVAIFVTAAVELIANMLRLRSVNLVQGLAWMLGDSTDNGVGAARGPRSWLAKILIAHKGGAPVVGNEGAAVAPDTITAQVLKHQLVSRLAAGNRVTSHIDPKLFATALVAVLSDPAKTGKNINDAFADLAGLVKNAQNDVIRDALTPIIAQAQASAVTAEEKVAAGVAAIEQWYDRSMNQASDWYKARIQRITVLFALLVAVGGNIDAIKIAETLWSDNTLRQVVVAQAMAAAENPTLAGNSCADTGADAVAAIKCNERVMQEAMASLKGLPVGWKVDATSPTAAPNQVVANPDKPVREHHIVAFLKHIPGWLLTAAAASLGAPFWFGLLQKVTPLRNRGGAATAATAK